MTQDATLIDHYGKDGLVGRLSQALDEAGLNQDRVSWSELSALDQFHTRGLEATIELAQLAGIPAGAHVIDIGSGLGGPSRFLAAKFGCLVKGIDLSPEFVAAAGFLTKRCGLDGSVEYRCADALALPFDDHTFDLAWSQHVAMNIADRDRLYREIFRVLRPGGRFAVYDVTAGDAGEILFPVPWSPGPGTSFVLSPEDMRARLTRAGFRVISWADRSRDGIEWFDRRKAGRGAAKPSSLGLHVAMGPDFLVMSQNLERNLREGRVSLTEAVLERS